MSSTNKIRVGQPGDLQVWWIPQVPMQMFTVDVPSVEIGALVMETLARYDTFQYEHNIKPDFANSGGLRRWTSDCDGEGHPGWEDWYDEETGEDDPIVWLGNREEFAK